LIHDNRMLAERAFYCFYVSTKGGSPVKQARKSVSVYSRKKLSGNTLSESDNLSFLSDTA